MKKKMIAAVCMAAVSLMVMGCGGSAEAAAQDGSQMGLESQDTAEESEEAADGAAEDAQESEEAADGAAEDAQGSEAASDGADEGRTDQASAESEPVQLDGKTISILGDSISTFRGHNPEGYAVFYPEYGDVKAVEGTWWQRVMNDLGLTLYKNGSSAGATAVGDSTGTEDPLCACNELRIGALTGAAGACPEIIIVFLGTNDLLNGVSMGTNDGTMLVEEGEITTFSDAYTLMLDKLLANYPPAEIYCCTLLPVGDYGTQTPYVDFVTTDGLTAADYSRTIVQIAENKGLVVVDLQDCGITIDNLAEMTTDGVHPTADGMACIAEAVKRALVGR